MLLSHLFEFLPPGFKLEIENRPNVSSDGEGDILSMRVIKLDTHKIEEFGATKKALEQDPDVVRILVKNMFDVAIHNLTRGK